MSYGEWPGLLGTTRERQRPPEQLAIAIPPWICSNRNRCQMSNGIIVQYMGFEAKQLTREYTFNVREAGQEREFRLNIANEAFVSHRAGFKDAPGICALWLQVELATYSNHPPETQYEITCAELDTYRQARSPRIGRKSLADLYSLRHSTSRHLA